MTAHDVSVHDSVEDVNRNQWNNVVEQSDLGSVFHRYEWLLSVERALEYDPRHVVVTKKGNPVAVFPNFVTPIDLAYTGSLLEQLREAMVPVSLLLANVSNVSPSRSPPSANQLVSAPPGFGGPVVTGDEEALLDLLFDGVSDADQRSVLLHAIKTKEPEFVRYGKYFAKRGYRPSLLTCRFELDLHENFEELLSAMDKERRKALRNARSNEHDVEDRPLDHEAIPETYDRYVDDMNRVDGHVLPREFFEALASEMPERTRTFTAEVDGTDVGRYVYVLDDEQSTIHYFFSAIGDESHFEFYPSELLHAQAMEWGQANGYRYYDFGNTGADFMDGTFHFKDKFGGRALPTIRWEKGFSRLLWSVYRLARRKYQRLKY